jgi:hypothetical protein
LSIDFAAVSMTGDRRVTSHRRTSLSTPAIGDTVRHGSPWTLGRVNHVRRNPTGSVGEVRIIIAR